MKHKKGLTVSKFNKLVVCVWVGVWWGEGGILMMVDICMNKGFQIENIAQKMISTYCLQIQHVEIIKENWMSTASKYLKVAVCMHCSSMIESGTWRGLSIKAEEISAYTF